MPPIDGRPAGSRPWRRRVLALTAALGVLAVLGGGFEVARRTRAEAHRLITNPIATRQLPASRPIDYGMVYDEVTATTSDGLKLAGWYVPSGNGAAILLQHGYKADRSQMLNEAAMLHRHGYGALLMSIRAHDLSDGEVITFGSEEMKDLEAWLQVLRAQPEVDPDRIGAIGNSLGGSLVLEFAARHAEIKAVVANSAFSSLTDTIETSLRYFTKLPPFPFAPLIAFWAEREGHFRVADVDAKKWIGRISPRPVLLMQGGEDVVISRESGERLFDAAREPKELWVDPHVGHTQFDTARPAEYERRVIALFDRYLLSGAGRRSGPD